MRKKTPIGNVTLLYELDRSTGNKRNDLTPYITNAQRIRADSSALSAPSGSPLYSNSHDRLFCICFISGKEVFELQVPVVYLIDLTDI